MTNEEVFDDDFYQEDFSSASVWEAFISQLGEILENYDAVDGEPLKQNELSLCKWLEESEEIQFNDFSLIVKRYKAKVEQRDSEVPKTMTVNQVFQDITSQDNDYSLLDVNYLRHDYEILNAPKAPNIHPVAVFYGLRDFVIIKSKRKSVTDVSQIKLLQSSLFLAVNESKCKIPAFVQVLYHEQDVYLGIYDTGEQRLSFDIVHLKSPTPSCKYLSGLLDMFKGKIGVNYVNPVMVSVCLTYSLKNFLSATYTSDKKSDNDDWDIVDFVNVISSLNFGVSADPVCEILLYTKWPQVSENVVFDSQTYSDFNPINAQKWSIRTRFDYTPVCYLADMLHEFLTLTECPEVLSEYYNFLNAKNRITDTNPFAALTDSKMPSLPGMSLLDSGSYTIDGPLNEQQLKKMFNYLLPDEDEERKFPYGGMKDEPVRTKNF